MFEDYIVVASIRLRKPGHLGQDLYLSAGVMVKNLGNFNTPISPKPQDAALRHSRRWRDCPRSPSRGAQGWGFSRTQQILLETERRVYIAANYP